MPEEKGEISSGNSSEVERRALRLLVFREHSRAELCGKLKLKGATPELAERVLDSLEAQNALNDRRFTEAYIAVRQARGFGPIRIRQELMEKGVAGELIQECLMESDPHWDWVLQQAARRRFGACTVTSYQEWAKRVRFLEYRGFSLAVIKRVLVSGWEFATDVASD